MKYNTNDLREKIIWSMGNRLDIKCRTVGRKQMELNLLTLLVNRLRHDLFDHLYTKYCRTLNEV
jgi:hypothetical protein